MYIILYNPLSNKGKGFKRYDKICKKLAKRKVEYAGYNLLNLDGKEKEFISSLKKEDDIVIIGGDGTLHQVVNRIKGVNLVNRVFFCKGGSGNDFSRDHKGNFFEITHEIKSLPKVKANDEEHLFINGVGMGIDAAVCRRVNSNAIAGIKESYGKATLKTLKTFKPFSVDLVIDGAKAHFDKVWFLTVQNGCYFGGGMKIAPHAKRGDDHLDLMIVHSVKIWKFLLIFPFIFIGKHLLFKRVGIEEIFCKNVILDCEEFDTIQEDGETFSDVHHMEISI